MIKVLNFNGEKYNAEKIVKTATDIIGKDINNNVVFAFRGVSDFSLFTLDEGQTFDVEENLEETTAKEVASLKIDNMKKDVMITSALQTIADLKVQVMKLKGGNT
jgi:hypothetical protein